MCADILSCSVNRNPSPFINIKKLHELYTKNAVAPFMKSSSIYGARPECRKKLDNVPAYAAGPRPLADSNNELRRQ